MLTAPQRAPAPLRRGLAPLPRRSVGEGERLTGSECETEAAARTPRLLRWVCCIALCRLMVSQLVTGTAAHVPQVYLSCRRHRGSASFMTP